MASVYRGVGIELPTRLSYARDHTRRRFAELLAQYMPFDLVIDEETADGQEARVSKTSVCGSWGPIAGELRYFADRFGVPRAAIEGTQIPIELIHRYATRGGWRRRVRPTPEAVTAGPPAATRVSRVRARSGIRAAGRVPAGPRSRAFTGSWLMRSREVRRGTECSSGTGSPSRRSARPIVGPAARRRRLGVAELTPLYQRALADVHSLDDFRASQLRGGFRRDRATG